MELTNLDFQQARIKQVLFKSRLRSVLYGVREPDDSLFAIRENPLGQWLYAVIQPQYGSTSQFLRLERELQQMLLTGQSLVRQYQRGQLEESRAGLERLDAHAARIETLLLELEQAV
ncbi:CZB domain-containing protein [Hymenobacter aerophilus]|uniref:CZB domain-containing protein n=1 Tax=Hymenobacter aerophilus TaxID=119644 RepID=UPI00035D1813|nr:CZB domain-containing protein [Hymenobacter aerophilus]